jgi:3-oxoacid CoA-transferase subunit A
MINKVVASAADAVSGVMSGSSIAIGGFGQVGVPVDLIDAICDADLRDLHIISNNGGIGAPGERGIGRLLVENRVRRFTCSFPINEVFFEAYFAGSVEIELTPQGTLAERLRAGGSGIGAFYTPTGVSTLLGDGGFITRHASASTATLAQEPKDRRVINGRTYVLDYPLRPNFALVKAHRADRYGNLRFRLGARNFNPLAAMAAQVTVVEVTDLLTNDVIEPDDSHLPGVFVDRIVASRQPDSFKRSSAIEETP